MLPAARSATWLNGPPELAALSTLKPVSLSEPSVQVRSIWLVEAADADKPVGAAGGTGVGAGVRVVAEAVLE